MDKWFSLHTFIALTECVHCWWPRGFVSSHTFGCTGFSPLSILLLPESWLRLSWQCCAGGREFFFDYNNFWDALLKLCIITISFVYENRLTVWLSICCWVYNLFLWVLCLKCDLLDSAHFVVRFFRQFSGFWFWVKPKCATDFDVIFDFKWNYSVFF